MPNTWSITEAWANNTIKQQLPARPKDSHKNQFGHVVVIGGDVGMVGAILMAGRAALRVGAGLVTLITNNLHTAHSIALTELQPELIVYGVDENILLDNKAEHGLGDILNRATVIILGRGLGTSDWSHRIFEFSINYIIDNLLANHLKALLIDADGLNLLSKYTIKQDCLTRLAQLQNKLILTPHPGEAKRLLHSDKSISAAEDRIASANKIAIDYNAVVILKGSGTLICRNKDGNHDNIAICNYGNPGMSSAGMGDVLSGIIGGITAQNVDIYTACCLAVYLHARAGDLQAQKYGERGLLATDLFFELRGLLNRP